MNGWPLRRIIENLAQAPKPLASASLAQVTEHVAKGFGVGPDEVAILTLTDQGKCLKFLIPEELQAVGTIPMTSTTALAARTAREKRAEFVNNFTATRHASVFEGVPLGRPRLHPERTARPDVHRRHPRWVRQALPGVLKS